jgi:outer membrane protein OmpA-like peptidoglycan-associated protein
MTMVEVPLHISNPPAIQRNVQVSGGTNWDLSRSAVQTPIVPLADPEPVRPPFSAGWALQSEPSDNLPHYRATDRIPAEAPSQVSFPATQAALSKAGTKALQSMNKKKAYLVVGHADASETSPETLSWSRARNVAAMLKRSGHKVSLVKAFGADRPASRSDNALNRRVEVYTVAR